MGLYHDFFGAVILRARMGINEHIEENVKVFSFKLESDDQTKIQSILDTRHMWDL